MKVKIIVSSLLALSLVGCLSPDETIEAKKKEYIEVADKVKNLIEKEANLNSSILDLEEKKSVLESNSTRLLDKCKIHPKTRIGLSAYYKHQEAIRKGIQRCTDTTTSYSSEAKCTSLVYQAHGAIMPLIFLDSSLDYSPELQKEIIDTHESMLECGELANDFPNIKLKPKTKKEVEVIVEESSASESKT